MKTVEYLDEIKKAHPDTDGKPASDYRVAKLLKVAKATVSKYRLHGTCFDDEVAARAGDLLDMPAYIVIIDMHYERAQKKKNTQVMQAWEDIAKKLTGTAAGILLTASLIAPQPVKADQFNITPLPASLNNNNYYAAFNVNMLQCIIYRGLLKL